MNTTTAFKFARNNRTSYYECHVDGCRHLIAKHFDVCGSVYEYETPADACAAFEKNNDGCFTTLGPCAKKVKAAPAPAPAPVPAPAEIQPREIGADVDVENGVVTITVNGVALAVVELVNGDHWKNLLVTPIRYESPEWGPSFDGGVALSSPTAEWTVAPGSVRVGELAETAGITIF